MKLRCWQSLRKPDGHSTGHVPVPLPLQLSERRFKTRAEKITTRFNAEKAEIEERELRRLNKKTEGATMVLSSALIHNTAPPLTARSPRRRRRSPKRRKEVQVPEVTNPSKSLSVVEGVLDASELNAFQSGESLSLAGSDNQEQFTAVHGALDPLLEAGALDPLLEAGDPVSEPPRSNFAKKKNKKKKTIVRRKIDDTFTADVFRLADGAMSEEQIHEEYLKMLKSKKAHELKLRRLGRWKSPVVQPSSSAPNSSSPQSASIVSPRYTPQPTPPTEGMPTETRALYKKAVTANAPVPFELTPSEPALQSPKPTPPSTPRSLAPVLIPPSSPRSSIPKPQAKMAWYKLGGAASTAGVEF